MNKVSATAARLPVLAAAMVISAAAPAAAMVPAVNPGFPNVPQTAGALLSGLNAPEQGRTAIIAYHNGILFTVPEVPSSQPGADFLVRTWDLADPTQPVILQTLEETPMPVNAHGYLKSGDYLVLGPNWPPGGEWSFQYTPTPARVIRGAWPDLAYIGARGTLFQPWIVHQTYWSYNTVGGDATIEFRGSTIADWDHLGMTGVIGHPFLIGDLLIFASDQSRTGVATYDLSDPTDPVLLDVLTTGGPGGYWPEVWGGDGKLYVVFPYRTAGNGIRVVDATDPSDLRLVADQPLPGAACMYMQFQDEYAFTGDHKVDMRTFQSVVYLDGANVTRTNDGGTGIDTSQFSLPLGNLWVTGGIGPNEGMAIWAHQDAPDTRGPVVGYHRPLAGQTDYPTTAPVSLLIHETLETFTIINGETFLVRPVGGNPLSGRLTFAFDDVLTFTPDAPLAADTTYEVVVQDGGIKDAAGNGIAGLTFTFSTGSGVGGNRPPVVDALVASGYPIAPGATVTLTASASDPDMDALQYRFDAGDGTPKSAWSSSATIDLTYAAAGHYQPTAQVRDPSGAVATGRTTVTVLTPPPGPRPTQSAPVLCDAAARMVWVVNPDNDTLAAVDADALTVRFEVPTCDDPRSLGRSATGELYVACHDGDTVWLHDATGRYIGALDTDYGSAPAGLAMAPDGNLAYVALQGSGELARIDTRTASITGRIAVGPTPRAVAVSGDGATVLVTRLRSPEDHAEVYTVDAASFAPGATARLAKFGWDENADTTASGRGVANYLTGVAVAPTGGTAWVAANKPNAEKGLFFFTDLDQDNTVRNVAVQVDLSAGSVAQAVDLDNSDSASAVAYSPLGDYLFVTLQGNDEVVVLDALRVDTATGLGSLVTRFGAGLGPQGVCVDAPTGRTFVKNFLGRSVTVLETDALFRSGDITVASQEIGTVASETLAADVLLGKQHFYNAADPRMSAEGYLSCASCHLDGGHDGRVWDFTGRGEGFRNTTSLRGRGGMAHGNVHWSANFDEIQDFENDIRGGFGGAGFLTDAEFAATSAPLGPAKTGLSADLDALAAYVASLGADTVPKSPHRNPDGSLTAAAVAGQTVFAANGCDSCHTGSAYTDSTLGTATLHDVGTLRTSSGDRLSGPLTGIDTPTLLGVWNTAPYLHDGSAATLEDVFVLAGGTILQAETGAVSAGAYVVDQWVEINNDDTVHGRAYVELSGGRLRFTGVDGGSGGLGAVELRYSMGWPTSVDVIVNGAPQTFNPTVPPLNPQWRQTIWLSLRVEDVALNPGPTNTVEIANGNLGIDDVLISTADERAQAAPHRRVLSLAQTERDHLLAFLRELDGRADLEAGRCSDGVDNDLDGRTDCDDSDCAADPACPGVAINRRGVLTPAPVPPIADLFHPSCRQADLGLCLEDWVSAPGTTLRVAGDGAAGPPALWLYQHSQPIELRMTRDVDDVILSW